MSMRITQGMMHSQINRNLNSTLNKLADITMQINTGRKLNKPSDDPIGVTYSVYYRSELTANQQYKKNVEDALSWFDFNDKTIGQSTDIMHRLKELATNAASSGGKSPETLNGIKKEVNELKDELLNIANSRYNGRYVFNGQKVDQMPYTEKTVASAFTDAGKIIYDIGAGVQIDINYSGGEIFGNPEDEDQIFKVLEEFSQALENEDYDQVNALRGKLESRFDKMQSVRSEVGAKVNRVELTRERLKDLETNLTSLQAKTEDADIIKLIYEEKIQENCYQTSLAVGSKIIMPSLVDFMR